MMIHSERSIKCNKGVRCAWKHHRKVKQLNSLEYRVNKAKAKAKKKLEMCHSFAADQVGCALYIRPTAVAADCFPLETNQK